MSAFDLRQEHAALKQRFQDAQSNVADWQTALDNMKAERTALLSQQIRLAMPQKLNSRLPREGALLTESASNRFINLVELALSSAAKGYHGMAFLNAYKAVVAYAVPDRREVFLENLRRFPPKDGFEEILAKAEMEEIGETVDKEEEGDEEL
ncbi:Hypothetical predicted protein [Lecanosticta acicola]|uniref:Uncharacterized protein n=1 Tax=Lecanosticta acicola TaxID=111012 RepID=A0AAI8Z5S9_9PEZI|nr:Hypothetical predicted protein [Lecanosticta acicola]